MRFLLRIESPDQLEYWAQWFETKAELNEWLAEEQTRPYWDKDFSVHIEDHSAEIDKAEGEAKEAADKANLERDNMSTRLKNIRNKRGKTVADALDAIDAILDYLGFTPDDPGPSQKKA